MWFHCTGLSLAGPGVLHMLMKALSLWSNDFWGQLYLDPIPINTEMAEIINAIIWSEDVPWVWCSFPFPHMWVEKLICSSLLATQFLYSVFYPILSKSRQTMSAFLPWFFILFKHTMQACLFLFCFTFIRIGSHAHTVQGKACFREMCFVEALTVVCILPSSLCSWEQCFSPC